MDKLSRLELTLGVEFNECSIASAELARRVDLLMSNEDNIIPRSLLVVEDMVVGARLFQTVPVSNQIQTSEGCDIQFMLARDTAQRNGRARLMAVTREDVAFPVASFARRAGSQCDYVQIGEEMTDDSLVVTPNDEYSRQDIIESMRKLFDVDPTSLIYHDILVEAHAKQSWRELKYQADNYKSNSELRINDKYSKVGVELLAVLSVCDAHVETAWLAWSSKMRLAETTRKLLKFFEKPDLKSIVNGKIPGSKNPIARNLLLIKAATKMGINITDDNINRYRFDREQTVHSTPRVLAHYVDLDKRINQYLGEPHKEVEDIVALAGRLAARGVLVTTERNIKISNTHGDVDLFVEVRATGSTTHHLMVRARPTAMSDHAPADIYSVVLDRISKVEFSELEAQELKYILGRVAVKK